MLFRSNRTTAFTATWSVPYQAGVLKAVGYRAGKQVNAAELKTAAAPVQIKLTPDRNRLSASGQDLSYVTVELLDDSGVRNPLAENLVTFTVTGPGTIAAVGSANPMSTESYQGPQRKAWQGRLLVILKAGKQPGEITLTATSNGLRPAKVVLAAQ